MFIFFFLFSNNHSLLTQNGHDYHALLQSILYSINHKECDCIEASMATKDIQ